MKPTLTLSTLALLALATTGFAQRAPKTYKNAKGQIICPVMKSVIPNKKAAVGSSVVKGVRYYFCCAGCKPAFDKNPGKYIKAAPRVPSVPKLPSPEMTTKRVGPYVIEIWPPEEGLFAGEPVDVEFGVFDSRVKEADGGLVGVANRATAVVTMPSMQGMPEQRPKIHKEGRAGVSGLELEFPHGGEYKIDLTITPESGTPVRTSFLVNVGDERPNAPVRPAYALEVVDWPATARAGEPVDLKLRVRDTKTGDVVTDFDVAHEQKFHLLLASKDLTRFLHEHPEMSPDGTWTYRLILPSGGPWMVYGDVAPSGRGSRILSTTLDALGDPPSGPGMRVEGPGPMTMGGLTGRIAPVGGPIKVGRMSVLSVTLTDAATGAPAGDTEPWLGAAGHLMIIHEDGKTVVHSHPQDDPATAALVKRGEVRFNARFPKPGRYVAYAQFQRAGEIKTLGFTVDVR